MVEKIISPRTIFQSTSQTSLITLNPFKKPLHHLLFMSHTVKTKYSIKSGFQFASRNSVRTSVVVLNLSCLKVTVSVLCPQVGGLLVEEYFLYILKTLETQTFFKGFSKWHAAYWTHRQEDLSLHKW